ncbi:MAG: elongation factor G [Kiritimatiellaeota bacterium]|nr:elongation factor G [Kiritimatiellota bacterium]
MKNCSVERIRNFCIAGHAGAGKTSLADLMLAKSGVVSRVGKVDQGTSVSDFRPDEQERKSSVYTAALNCPWQEHHFFFTDTPGYADFAAEPTAAIAVADAVLIVVDAVTGIGTGTIRAWQLARKGGVPRAFFINGLDRDQADYAGTLEALQESYGATVCIPFVLPKGEKSELAGVTHVLRDDPPPELEEMTARYREALMDTVAESDEELMMRYLDGEELTDAEIAKGLHQAILDSTVVPVFCGSIEKDVGVTELMNGIMNFFPDPLAATPVPLTEGELERTADADPAMARVFKSITDPFIGQLTMLRVYAGTFHSDSEVTNITRSVRERFGSLLLINGKEQAPTDEAGPGEIVAIAKLKGTHISDTLATKPGSSPFPPIQFPKPTMSYAVFPLNKGDEEKISSGLQKLADEDPTIRVERNSEIRQTLLSGMGDLHLTTVINRLKSAYKVGVELGTPKVPYRETITAAGSAQYRHKKQTGGHGQFAEVHLRLEPLPDQEFEFGNEVVGGNIPRNFIPAVEKGVLEAMQKGPLAKCRVMHVRAVVYDGKHHPVDSSEMAFKIAARGAFREAMQNARPILLEPIMRLKIMFPEEYMGDISGDLNSRRGRILGMDREEGLQVVHADVPLAETFTYSTQLRSITQGRGAFEMEFNRYEPVPANLTKQIQAAAEAEDET